MAANVLTGSRKHKKKGHSVKKSLKGSRKSSKSESSSEGRNSQEDQIFAAAWDALDAAEEHVSIAEAYSARFDDMVTQKLSERKLVYPKPICEKKATLLEIQLMGSIGKVKEKLLFSKDYDGPHFDVSNGITPKAAKALTEGYKNSKTLHYKYARDILIGMTKYLKQNSKAMHDITVPPNGQIWIVGDTHGQLEDVLEITKIVGTPSKNNLILFNGDLVDRGPMGPEVLLLVYCWKLAWPDYVFINRGNHEFYDLNARYGFEEQFSARYCPHLYKKALHTFKYLPFAHLIDREVLVIHAGLSDEEDIMLEEIKELPLRQFPVDPEQRADRKGKIMEGLLWSDPQEADGVQISRRGAGVHFGPDITKKFIIHNKLKKIVRSHELCVMGYKYDHDGMIITIFSASCYCQKNTNEGAVVLFKQGEYDKPHFKQFYIGKTESTWIEREVRQKQKNEVLEKIKMQIYALRSVLSLAFEKVDKDNDGRITRHEWAKAMEKVFPMKYNNWKELQPYLVNITHRGLIDYVKFLDRYRPREMTFSKSWLHEITHFIYTNFLTHENDIKAAFEACDLNDDGAISHTEFVKVLRAHGVKVVDDKLYDFMRLMDKNGDGKISFEEFYHTFRVEFDRGVQESDKAWLSRAVKKIGNVVFSQTDNLRESFKKLDGDKSGGLDYDEFKILFTEFGLSYKDDETKKIFDYIDRNKDGTISFREFKHAFRLVNPILKEDEVVVSLARVIILHKKEVRRIFRVLDHKKNGKVSFDQFKVIIESLGEVFEGLNLKVKDKHFLQLTKKAKKDGNDIYYKDWLKKFDLVDVETLKLPAATIEN